MSKRKPVDLISLQRKLTNLKMRIKAHIDTPFDDCNLTDKQQMAVWCKVRGFTIAKTAAHMEVTTTPAHSHLKLALKKIGKKRDIVGLKADDLATVLIRDIERELY